MQPEVEQPETLGRVQLKIPATAVNVWDAAAKGASVDACVHALVVDVGQQEEWEAVRRHALALGAKSATVRRGSRELTERLLEEIARSTARSANASNPKSLSVFADNNNRGPRCS